MAKYDPFADYLRAREGDEVELDFAVIADLVGGLPPTAYSDRPWWANTVSPTRSQAISWMRAGWRVFAVDLAATKVRFRRASEVSEVPAPGRRAWLVRGSNVKGVDLIPRWRAEGWCSQPASQLPEVPAGILRDELKALVDAHYQGVSYSQRKQKLDEFHAFLSVMQVGDVVATTSQGRLYLGEITSDAGYAASEGGRSNLRRTVDWQPRCARAQIRPEASRSRSPTPTR